MKILDSLPAYIVSVFVGFALGAIVVMNIYEKEGIRSPHRITPRLELVIDSGRVDTVFVYKLK